MLEALISKFAQIEDPRCDWRVEHKLLILVIAVCAVIGEAAELRGHRTLRPLQTRLAGPLPRAAGRHSSHDTFRRVLMLIDPSASSAAFSTGSARYPARCRAPRQIAIDGKTVRRSFDRQNGRSLFRPYVSFGSTQRKQWCETANPVSLGLLCDQQDIAGGGSRS